MLTGGAADLGKPADCAVFNGIDDGNEGVDGLVGTETGGRGREAVRGDIAGFGRFLLKAAILASISALFAAIRAATCSVVQLQMER
jgi:hypothetical protein